MYYDQQDGIYLTQHRAYSPTIRRWLSRDPSGEQAGPNLFAYVGGDPVNGRDPTGLLRVHIWNYRGSQEAWGHASITLDDGTYISWWPSNVGRQHWPTQNSPIYTAPPFSNESLQLESGPKREGQPPDENIQIEGLNEPAIEDWWNVFKVSQQWNTVGENCSTVAAAALTIGGGLPYAAIGGGIPTPIVWTPSDVEDYANHIQTGLSIWQWFKNLTTR